MGGVDWVRPDGDGGSVHALFRRVPTLAINIAFLLQISPRNPQSATRNSQSAIRPFLLANAAVVLLFAPWISVIVTRLRVDTSYWQGALKLGEALHDIAIRFTLGETVLESAATPWLWLYAVVTVWGIANCGLRIANDKLQVTSKDTTRPAITVLYSSLYLLLPIAAVLALAALTPKFNPLRNAGATGADRALSAGLGAGIGNLTPIPSPQSPVPNP
ncbi:MAG: hypothetical protein R2856_27230 [Caldilineaceae bacterium]